MTWFIPRNLSFKGCYSNFISICYKEEKGNGMENGNEGNEMETRTFHSKVKDPEPIKVKITLLDQEENKENDPLSIDNYIKLPILNFDTLTKNDALKPSYEVTLDKRELKWKKEENNNMENHENYPFLLPGDSLEFKVYNDPEIVSMLIDRLALTLPNQIVHIESIDSSPPAPPKGSLAELFIGKSISPRRLFEEYVDLNYFPKKAHLLQMSRVCIDPLEANDLFHLCTPEGSNLYIQMIKERTTLMDILNTWKSCKMSLEMILWFISPLPHRPYSISSNIFDKERISFVFNRIEYFTPEGLLRKGIASSFLQRQSLSSKSSILHATRRRKERITSGTDGKISQVSNLPPLLPPPFIIKENGHPIILICAGVGIGPFISFLRSISHQRRARRKRMEEQEANLKSTISFTNFPNGNSGNFNDFDNENIENHFDNDSRIWLIYGFRSRNQDFLFQDLLETFVKEGILSQFHIAVSRDDGNHVQDLMLKHQFELFEMLMMNQGTLYLCGDELTMIKDVNDTLLKIIESCSLENEKIKENASVDSKEILKEWIRQGRILKDIWI